VAWQEHLRAATNMYQREHEKNFTELGLRATTSKIVTLDLSLPRDDSSVAEETMCFRFLSGSLTWLDIIFSITAGRAPFLSSHYSRILNAESRIQLQDITGCQNWAMLQVARISAFYELKTQAIQQGDLDQTSYERTAGEINLEIECGLSQSAIHMLDPDSPWKDAKNHDAQSLVTQMVAYMATAYLHLVMHGFQKLELLDTTLSSAIRMLQTQVPSYVLPSLIAPIYVIGILAQEDQHFFREILSAPPLLDPLYRHRMRLLPVMEEIWKRRSRHGFAWKDCIDLTDSILLV
jgi:hypothetical protein